MITRKIIDDLSYEVIGAAIEVHKTLGGGLLERVYHDCLKEELKLRSISFVSELAVPLQYKDVALETNLRCDLFIENSLVLELKSVQNMLPMFEAQVLTYMNLLKAPKGVLLNFYCQNIFKEGQKTFVNQYYKDLAE